MERAAYHALGSKMLCQAARIDPGDPRNAGILESVLEASPRAPVAWGREPPNDQPPDLQFRRFKEPGQSPLVARRGRRDAVVPEQRVGEGQDLSPERRVGQGFRIPDHPGSEDDLADDRGGGTETDAIESRTVFEE